MKLEADVSLLRTIFESAGTAPNKRCSGNDAVDSYLNGVRTMKGTVRLGTLEESQ
jgi:hypothetical protein